MIHVTVPSPDLPPQPRTLTIYIASSWKNQHAVEMLTDLLRTRGHKVLSFVENNHGEQKGHAAADASGKSIPFDEWVQSDRGLASFNYDTHGAMFAQLVIYIGPSGTDAWAEVGAAYGAGVPILGLLSKGEQAGLMRLMMRAWFTNFRALLDQVAMFAGQPVSA